MNQQPASGTPAQVDVLGSPAYDVTLAFETFYAQEIRGLVALAAGLCGRAWAEGVAQEAMLVTCRRWREVGRRDHRRPSRDGCAPTSRSTLDSDGNPVRVRFVRGSGPLAWQPR